jgi:hypothetical protein
MSTVKNANKATIYTKKSNKKKGRKKRNRPVGKMQHMHIAKKNKNSDDTISHGNQDATSKATDTVENLDGRVRATVVSGASQAELEELHTAMSELQSQTEQSRSVVADKEHIIAGLRSEVSTLREEVEISDAVSKCRLIFLRQTQAKLKDVYRKFEGALQRVDVLDMVCARLRLEVSAAQETQCDAARAQAVSVSSFAVAKAVAAARLADSSRAVVAAERRSEGLDRARVVATTELALAQAEVASSQRALVSVQREVARERALSNKVALELSVMRLGVKCCRPETTFDQPMAAAAAAGDYDAALGALVPMDATRTTDRNLDALVHSCTMDMAVTLVLACEPFPRIKYAPGRVGSEARSAMHREQVIQVRKAVCEVMHTTVALAEACVTTAVATNHLSLYSVLCLLIKARLVADCTYSTELPITHALFYARRYNAFIQPRGYRGSSLPGDIAILHPEFLQADSQLPKLLRINTGAVGDSAEVRSITQRLNIIERGNLSLTGMHDAEKASAVGLVEVHADLLDALGNNDNDEHEVHLHAN